MRFTQRLLITALFLQTVPILSAAETVGEPDPVIAAAESWLSLIDSGDYTGSWREASTTFQSSIGEVVWTQQVPVIKQQLGTLTSREDPVVEVAIDPPGAPPGEYRRVLYRSHFTNIGAATEIVVLAEDGERGWRVVGYFVQPPG